MSYRFETIYFDNPIVTNRSIDIFVPEEITQEVAVLFVHGGGWFGGSKTGHHKVMRGFNRAGFICGAIDYRLGSEILITDQIADVRHGYDIFTGFLKDHDRPVNIFVIGSSAGAHLGGLLCLAAPGECEEDVRFNGFVRKHEWETPVGCALQAAPVMFEPWEDIFPHIWDAMQKIVGKDYDNHQALYRKFALNSYLNKNSCPVFHLAAANEHMFPIEYAEAFVLAQNKLGIKGKFKVYSNTEHGFFYDLTRRQQKEAFHDIINFIESIEIEDKWKSS